jgi:hypothetical protein
MKNIPVIIALLGIAIVMTGCSRREEVSTPAGAPADVPAAVSAVFAAIPVEGELSPIPKLRQTAKPGDKVVMEAKIMGTKTPFVDNRAVIVVGDEGTLTSCDIHHADACSTPWDNCCDEPAAVRAGTATIQVVDEAGNVLRHGLKGVSGLKELSRLRIAGEVAPNSSETAFIVNATRIEIL